MALPKHILESVRLYFQKEINGKHPISETDGLIIKEISLALRRLNCNDLAATVEMWKRVSDDQIYDNLIEYNDSLAKNARPTEEDELGLTQEGSIYWLSIKGVRLKASLIGSWEPENVYVEGKINAGVRYAMLINSTSNNNIPYANTRIFFETEQARDKKLEQMEGYFELFGNSIFLK